MEIKEQEVDYYKYCRDCKHISKKGTEDPCNECLTLFTNDNTDRPVLFEPAEDSR